MPTTPDESLMRAAFAPARELEPSPAEIAGVLTRVDTPRRRLLPRVPESRRRLIATGAVGLVLLAGGAYAVPPTRAALEGVANTFSDWVAGDEDSAPGRPLAPGEDAPAFLRDTRYSKDPRVIAQAGRYRLYVTRQGNAVTFELGNTGVGLGFPINHLAGETLYVLGPAAMRTVDRHGHVPLFGATADSVARVELLYESGAPTEADSSEGGFVLLAEPGRSPREVVAYDSHGNVVDRQLVDDSAHEGPRIDWSHWQPNHGSSRPSQPR